MEQPRPPKHLPPKARQFWAKVYPVLADRLKPSDLPGFELLCLNWHLIHSTDPIADPKSGVVHFAAQKQFNALSKQFGLTPDARRRVDPPKAETLSDVLGGLMMEKR